MTHPRIAKILSGLALTTLTLLAACGPRTEFTLPDEFVALTKEDIRYKNYDWKAVNADGVVVVLRERDNDQGGSLQFWLEALEREIVEGHGYELTETVDVKTRNMSGKQLRFLVDYGGTPYHYHVALFVIDGEIVTIETTYPDSLAEGVAPTLDEIVQSALFD